METGKRTERTMGLTICNGFSSTISFAIGWPDSSQCANSGKWKKRGWWNVAPGQCARVYGSSLKSFSRMAYYGRTYDRSREWRGSTGTYVVDAVFQHCWNDPPDPQFGGYYRVLFRLLDVNHLENYTLNINR